MPVVVTEYVMAPLLVVVAPDEGFAGPPVVTAWNDVTGDHEIVGVAKEITKATDVVAELYSVVAAAVATTTHEPAAL